MISGFSFPGINIGIRALINSYWLIIYTYAVSTLRVFPGVGVSASLLLVGVLMMVPYSRSSSVCFTFFICYTVPTSCQKLLFKIKFMSEVVISRRMCHTRSCFSLSFSMRCWFHWSSTYCRNGCPFTRNSLQCAASHRSIWAFRLFSSWPIRQNGQISIQAIPGNQTSEFA